MNRNPLVSVIINCLNGEKFLNECFNSIIGQSYKNIEIIFYDNNSTDKSLQIASSFQSIDKRVKIFACKETKNLGIVRSRAVKKSLGELISFIDVDDVWFPHKLRLQVEKFLEEEDVGFVYGRVITKKANSYFTDKKITKPSKKFFNDLLVRNFLTFSCVMFSRVAYDLAGGFDQDYKNSIDYKLFLDIAKKHKVSLVDKYLCVYRDHDENLSKKQRIIAIEETIKIIKLHSDIENLHSYYSKYITYAYLEKKEFFKMIRSLSFIDFIYILRRLTKTIFQANIRKINNRFVEAHFTKKKILFFHTNSLGGGAEKIFNDLITNLNQSEFEVSEIAMLEKNLLGVKGSNFAFSLSNVLFFFKFLQHCRKNQYDIILSSIYYTSFIALFTKLFIREVNIVINIHNGIKYCDLKLIQKIVFKFLAKKSYNKNVKLISCSSSAAMEHIENGFKDDINIIFNGMDSTPWKPRACKNIFFREESKEKKQIIIGYFARYHRLKNQEFLIDILFSLRKNNINAKLLMAGTGVDHDNKNLTKKIESYDLNKHVILLGQSSKINDLMNQIDIYVSPSLAEAFPISLIEANLTGKYVVSGDVGDSRIIAKKNGVTIPRLDKDLYVNEIIKYFNFDKKTREELSVKGIKFCRNNFSKEKMVSQYQDFFENLYYY